MHDCFETGVFIPKRSSPLQGDQTVEPAWLNSSLAFPISVHPAFGIKLKQSGAHARFSGHSLRRRWKKSLGTRQEDLIQNHPPIPPFREFRSCLFADRRIRPGSRNELEYALSQLDSEPN